MTSVSEWLPGSGFLASFLAGMAVDYEISAIALLMGLAIGIPLAYVNLAGGRARPLPGSARLADARRADIRRDVRC